MEYKSKEVIYLISICKSNLWLKFLLVGQLLLH